VTTRDESVQVEVRDTGEGIRAEDLPHVFDRFYHGEAQDGRVRAGLGLALVKELTEAMGGSVAASSTPGEGSSFLVRLPRWSGG
jgi:two-component system sensor histidine kinase BaeS